MPAAVAQRLLGLAAVALLAGLIALAVDRAAERRREPRRRHRPAQSHPVAAGTPRSPRRAGPAGDAERTTCGLILTNKSLGVTHPVLPCGAKLLLRFGGQTVLTEVIDNKLEERRPPVRAHRAARRPARDRRHAGDRLALRGASQQLAASGTRDGLQPAAERLRPRSQSARIV